MFRLAHYSGIVQSVEQRTVKAVAAQKKVLRKTAEICGFFNIYSPNTGYNFWKKVSVFYAIICFLLPLFCKMLYIDIWKSQTYVFAYAKNIFKKTLTKPVFLSILQPSKYNKRIKNEKILC